MSRHSLLARAQEEAADTGEMDEDVERPTMSSFNRMPEHNSEFVAIDTFGFDSFWSLAPMSIDAPDSVFGSLDVALPF